MEAAEHDMLYELEAFMRMGETGEGAEARRQCGIRFPADRPE